MRLRRAAVDGGLVAVAAAEAWATRSLGGPLALTAAYAAAGALALRRRLPLTVLLATLPALSLGYVWLAPMAALYTIAADGGAPTVACTRRLLRRGTVPLPGRRGITPPTAVTWGGAAAVAFVSFFPWPWIGEVDWAPAATVLAVLLSALLAVAPTALGLLTASRRELAARLAELAESRERERRLAAERAVVRERTRLAREMHDTVAHHISLIAVQSGALEATARGDEARAAAGTVRQLSREALDELRHLVGLLRMPVAGGGQDAGPGLAELPTLLAAAGPEVHGDLPAAGRAGCPPPVQHAAYRTVQEALTNVRKHAPGARTEVTVRLAADALHVAVRNAPVGEEGRGPALPSGGHGLTGLRERAAALGGTLDAGPEPDGGFLVRATLPLDACR
ncbi:sensor histidine kinase [Actinacidiphila glaucinigra]|uniref:sensor histidine kinase n=1 Tax=Actinacidiphila glaucinigra TaxID=235986 RepID=UPI0035DA2A55